MVRFSRSLHQNVAGENLAADKDFALSSLEYGKRTVTVYRPEDKELWDFINEVPSFKGVWPYVCSILSIVLPGSGTMICSCAGYTTS